MGSLRRESASSHSAAVFTSVRRRDHALSAALAQGLASASLVPPRQPARLCLLETSTRAETSLTPGNERLLADWRAAGWQAEALAVQGPPFWQTTEIEDAPGLLAATAALLAMTPSAAA